MNSYTYAKLSQLLIHHGQHCILEGIQARIAQTSGKAGSCMTTGEASKDSGCNQ
jgi:hypothetical protein